MSKVMTTNTIIADVKRRAMIPASQQTFLDADFIAFINEEMDIGVVPLVLSFHEEFFVYTEKITITPNQTRYQIPGRAVGNKLRELAYEDDGGNIFEMSRIAVDDVPSYQKNIIQNAFTLFYVEGNEIVLVPETGPTPTGKLRFSYYMRPNQIVSEDRVALITGIDRVSGNISVDKVPANIAVGAEVDLVQTKSPNRTLGVGVIPQGINTTTKTFTFDPATIPPLLAIGDQIALAEECIVPQIPVDLHSMLSQRVAARCLEALGDTQGLTNANTKLAEMEQKTGALIDNRVEGAPMKVVNKHSMLKRRKLYWRW